MIRRELVSTLTREVKIRVYKMGDGSFIWQNPRTGETATGFTSSAQAIRDAEKNF